MHSFTTSQRRCRVQQPDSFPMSARQQKQLRDAESQRRGSVLPRQAVTAHSNSNRNCITQRRKAAKALYPTHTACTWTNRARVRLKRSAVIGSAERNHHSRRSVSQKPLRFISFIFARFDTNGLVNNVLPRLQNVASERRRIPRTLCGFATLRLCVEQFCSSAVLQFRSSAVQ